MSDSKVDGNFERYSDNYGFDYKEKNAKPKNQENETTNKSSNQMAKIRFKTIVAKTLFAKNIKKCIEEYKRTDAENCENINTAHNIQEKKQTIAALKSILTELEKEIKNPILSENDREIKISRFSDRLDRLEDLNKQLSGIKYEEIEAPLIRDATSMFLNSTIKKIAFAKFKSNTYSSQTFDRDMRDLRSENSQFISNKKKFLEDLRPAEHTRPSTDRTEEARPSTDRTEKARGAKPNFAILNSFPEGFFTEEEKKLLQEIHRGVLEKKNLKDMKISNEYKNDPKKMNMITHPDKLIQRLQILNEKNKNNETAQVNDTQKKYLNTLTQCINELKDYGSVNLSESLKNDLSSLPQN